MTRQEEYIRDVRHNTKQLWEAYLFLKASQTEYNALDYGTVLSGVPGYEKGSIGAVVLDTTNAITDLLNSGHATNLAKLL